MFIVSEDKIKIYFEIINAYWNFFKKSMKNFEQTELYWIKLFKDVNEIYDKYKTVNKEFAYVMGVVIIRTIDKETQNIPPADITGKQMNVLELLKEDEILKRWNKRNKQLYAILLWSLYEVNNVY